MKLTLGDFYAKPKALNVKYCYLTWCCVLKKKVSINSFFAIHFILVEITHHHVQPVYQCVSSIMNTWAWGWTALESVFTVRSMTRTSVLPLWLYYLLYPEQREAGYPPGLGHAVPALVLAGAAGRGQLAAERRRELDPVLLHLPQLAGQIRHLGQREAF